MKYGCTQDALDRALRKLAPPDHMTPSEYAEKNLSISAENAIPGPIRFKNVPYQKEPLDMLASPGCYQVSLMWGAQCGKTTIVNCGQAYFMDHDPQSQICLFPTKDDLEFWLETKFDPMIQANDHLASLLRTPRASGKKAVDNKKMKSYPGGFLMFAWAGSANTMRQKSAPKIFCDEVDGYTRTKEGDPLKLIRKRSQTFGPRRMMLVTSTPTLKYSSLIEASYLEGDQRQYYIECPHCQTHQTLKFGQIKYDLDDEKELLRESCYYQCESKNCRGKITDSMKKGLVRKGYWKAKRKFRGHASYHLNELYSPFSSFSGIVYDYLQAVKDDDEQSFRNTSLAETWELVGMELDQNKLLQRKESFKAEVPLGSLVLTMGVDVQHDRLEWEVVSWGEGMESWSVDYQVIWGDTSLADDDEDGPWFAMDEYLETVFQGEDGSLFKISTICVDSSDQTSRVYNYCRRRAGRRVHAIKGKGGWDRPIVAAPTKQKTKKGKPCDLFTLGTDQLKREIHTKFNVEKKGRGYCHVPETRDVEWFEQLTAEKLVKEKKGSSVKIYWKQTRARNEALDCRQYATAGLYILAQDPLRFLKRRAKVHERRLDKMEKTPEDTKTIKANRKPIKQPRIKPKKVRTWK